MQGSYGHFLLLLFRTSWRLFWLALCFFWVYKRWTRFLFSYFPVMTYALSKYTIYFLSRSFATWFNGFSFSFNFPPCSQDHAMLTSRQLSCLTITPMKYFSGLLLYFKEIVFCLILKSVFPDKTIAAVFFTFEIVPLNFCRVIWIIFYSFFRSSRAKKEDNLEDRGGNDLILFLNDSYYSELFSGYYWIITFYVIYLTTCACSMIRSKLFLQILKLHMSF